MKSKAPISVLLRASIALVFTFALLPGVGCNTIKMPEAPVPITMPDATVDRVELVDQSDVASRYLIFITLTNPNDVALPMTDTQYALGIAGAAAKPYDGDTIPNATLPASGAIQLRLPAIVAAGGGAAGQHDGARGGGYDVKGSIRVFPPGQLKKVGYELGVPRPRVAFAGAGEVTMNIGGEVLDVPVIDAPDDAGSDTTTPTAPRRTTDDTDRVRPDEAPQTPGVGIE